MGIYGNIVNKFVEDRIRVLNEDTVGSSDDMKIDVYPQKTRELNGNPDNAYFEVYDNKSFKKASKIIRIRVGYPWITTHNSKKENWSMNGEEKKELQELLNSPTGINKEGYEGLTVYQSILKYYNIPLTWPMPDFTTIKPEPSKKDKEKEVKAKTAEHNKILEDIKKQEEKEAKKLENMRKAGRL